MAAVDQSILDQATKKNRVRPKLSRTHPGGSFDMKPIAIVLLSSFLSAPAMANEIFRLYRQAEARLELAVDHGHLCKEEIRVKGREEDDCEAFARAATGWRKASRELRMVANMASNRLLLQLDEGDIDTYYRLLDELNSILEYLEAHREAVR